MAQRSSRSKKSRGRARGTRNDVRKQPELRTGGGRTAKAQRAQEREAAGARSATQGPLIRMRPAGFGGLLLVLVIALIVVAGVVAAGVWLDRTNELSYPDSLWLYASIGMVAVAWAIGRVARRKGDTNLWAALTLLVPLGMLVAEQVLGPDCPTGGSCSAIGARGSLGFPGSIALVVGLALLAWAIARVAYRRALDRRPAQGRVRYGAAAVATLGSALLIGAPVAAAGVGLDIALRDTPDLASRAGDDVAKYCFDLGDDPSLEVRGAPDGVYEGWTTFAVRRAHETRPGVGGAKLPSDWTELGSAYPYEAIIAYSEGDVAALSCRRVAPDAGNATKADLKPNKPESNPLDPATTGASFRPNFYTQGPHVPTAAEKQAAAAKAKQAKKPAAKPKTAASAKAGAATAAASAKPTAAK